MYVLPYRIGLDRALCNRPPVLELTWLVHTDDMTKVRGKAPTGAPGSDQAERAGEKAGLETNLNIDEAV